MTTVTTTKRKVIFSDYMNTFIIESLLGLILLVWERGGRAKQILSSFIYIYIYRGLIQAIQMSGKRPKKLNYLIEFSTQINQLAKFPQSQAIYSSSRWKRTEMFQGFYPLNSPQGSVMNLCTTYSILAPHLHFIASQNSNLFQKQESVRPLG